MYVAITLHFPAPGHRDDLLAFMRAVIAGLAGAPGLLDADVCEAADGSHLAGFTRWREAADFERALPTILAFAPQRDPGWTTRPDEAIRLLSV